MVENPWVFSKAWVRDALGGYPGAKKGLLPAPYSEQEVRDIRKSQFRQQAELQRAQNEQQPPAAPLLTPAAAVPQLPLPVGFDVNAMLMGIQMAMTMANTGAFPAAPSPMLFNQQAMASAAVAAAHATAPALPATPQQHQGAGFRGGGGGRGRGRNGVGGGRGRGGGGAAAAAVDRVDPVADAARALAHRPGEGDGEGDVEMDRAEPEGEDNGGNVGGN
jgi:hypothetical protein